MAGEGQEHVVQRRTLNRHVVDLDSGRVQGADHARGQAVGLTADEIQAERERYRKWFETIGPYPRIAHLLESGVDPDDPQTRDERFDFGLNCLLDGIAAQLPAHRAQPDEPG